MKVLAVDYGTKRLGLAWADTTLGVVLPYGIIALRGEKSGASLVERQAEAVAAVVSKDQIHLAVIGFPASTNGQENRMTSLVKEFAFELGKRTMATIEFFDERFTSAYADAVGAAGATRDEKAAMAIAQGYLDSNKLC